MKKILFTIFVLLGLRSFSQTPILDTINIATYEEAMELTFGLLPQGHIPHGVLLNKSNPIVKLFFADGTLNDTTFNVFEWYYIQNAVRSGLAHPSNLMGYLIVDSLKNKFIENNDVLPFGVVDYDCGILRDSAFIDGSISVVGHRLIENNANLNKIYAERKIFCVSPLNQDIFTLNPKFILKNEFIFSNSANTIIKIEIDLDDGFGFKLVENNNVFQASYFSGGFKNIQTRFIYNNGDTLNSRSELYVNDPDIISKTASSYINYDIKYDVLSWQDTYPPEFGNGTNSVGYDFKKVEVGIWYGCGNNSGEIRKPFVIFGGYNPKDGKSLEYNGFAPWVNDGLGAVMGNSLGGWRGPLYETYNGFFTDESKNAPSNVFGSNGNEFLEKVRQEGYDILIVRFMDGIGYLQRNAHLVTQVIKDINNRINASIYVRNPGADIDPEAPGYPYTTQIKKPKHEIVVAGYSAGGLCSRLGLLLMEYQHEQHKCLPDDWKFPEHRTKLWIGMDCENQGSNTPIGFQMFLDFEQSLGYLPANPADIVNSLICYQALQLIETNGVATQNTLYHINNLNSTGGGNWNAGHHFDFDRYFADLTTLSANNPANLIGYPKKCYRIGVSQGSAKGILQTMETSGGSGLKSLIYNESPTSLCFNPLGTLFGYGPWFLKITPYREATAIALTPSNGNAFSCRMGLSIRTVFSTWHINIGHWKYYQNNFINNSEYYDVAPASTLPTHKIMGKKMPLSSQSAIAASLLFCNLKDYNSNKHGFSPTVSGLDIHQNGQNALPRLPNLNFNPTSLNILNQNNYNLNISGLGNQPDFHDFGYPHLTYPTNHYDITPLDAVYAIGDVNSTFYDDNTMHVEDPSPHIGEFLVEEIAPQTLYLSDRTIAGDPYFCNGPDGGGTIKKYYADFEARNSVLVGNQSIYKHNANNPYPRVRTPEGDFVIGYGGVVTVRANNYDGLSSVVLGAGFSAKAGSIFRAYVYGDSYCAPYSYRLANSNQPQLPTKQARPIITKSAMVLSTSQLKKNIQIALYPNPTTGSLYYNLKEIATFNYTIFDLSGRILKTGKMDESNSQINLSDFVQGVYFITIQNEEFKQTDRVILQ